MTGNNLLNTARALCFETAADYTDNAVALINGVLAETISYNNNLRQYKGLAKLDEIPFIEELEDSIPYEKDLTIGLSYLLVSKLLYDDGDLNKCLHWQNQAFEILQSGRKLRVESIVNLDFPEE